MEREKMSWILKPYISNCLRSHPACSFAFVLGTTTSHKITLGIDREANSHGDILQEGFVDHYNNLTLKSMFSIKYELPNYKSVVAWI